MTGRAVRYADVILQHFTHSAYLTAHIHIRIPGSTHVAYLTARIHLAISVLPIPRTYGTLPYIHCILPADFSPSMLEYKPPPMECCLTVWYNADIRIIAPNDYSW